MVQHDACTGNPWRLTGTWSVAHLPPRRMRRAFGFFSSILLAPAGEPDGGGGAGGSGGGSQQQPGGGDQPVGVTEDRVNEIVSKAVNRIAKDLEGKQTKALGDLQTAMTTAFATTLDEKLSALQQTPPGDKKTPPPDQASAELKQLRKELDATNAKLKQADADKAAERAKARDTKFRSDVESALSASGSNAARLARAALVDAGRIKYRDDESDDIIFVDEDGDELPLNKAIPEWLKSDDGKRFMPAQRVSGSGDAPGGSGGRRGTSQSSGDPAAPSRATIGEAVLALHGMPARQ